MQESSFKKLLNFLKYCGCKSLEIDGLINAIVLGEL